MDLSWCPVCDRRTFALENLYCSEACRRKDELNLSCSPTNPPFISESFYEFPRCASQKSHQSPTCSPTSTPNTTPFNSPGLHPRTSSSSTTNSMYCYSDYYYAIRSVPGSEEGASSKLSSSPSELLQLSRTLPKNDSSIGLPKMTTRKLTSAIYLACKGTILSSSIRKKRSFLMNGL